MFFSTLHFCVEKTDLFVHFFGSTAAHTQKSVENKGPTSCTKCRQSCCLNGEPFRKNGVYRHWDPLNSGSFWGISLIYVMYLCCFRTVISYIFNHIYHIKQLKNNVFPPLIFTNPCSFPTFFSFVSNKSKYKKSNETSWNHRIRQKHAQICQLLTVTGLELPPWPWSRVAWQSSYLWPSFASTRKLLLRLEYQWTII